MKTTRAPTPLKSTESTQSAVDVENRIRSRAYELYEQRGKEEGHALDDWLQAESEMKQENKGKAEQYNVLDLAV